MAEHWCHCDPQGDGRCGRECCQPREVNAAEAAAIVGKARRMRAQPSPEDMAEAIEALRMLASRTRSVVARGRLARVADWIEGESNRYG